MPKINAAKDLEKTAWYNVGYPRVPKTKVSLSTAQGNEPDAISGLEFDIPVTQMVLLRKAFSRFRRLRSYPFFPLGVEWNRVGLGVGIRTFSLGFAFAGIDS